MRDQAARYSSVLQYFLHWERTNPHAVFLRQPVGDEWMEYTWESIGDEARKVAGALAKRGLQRGDRVALLSVNCAQWVICDIALMMGGFISVPLYANVNSSSLSEILHHSDSRVLFIGKLLEEDWNNVRTAIPDQIEKITLNGYEKGSITTWKEFLQNTEAPRQDVIIPQPDDALTIIYTSGTTGTSKGVVHTNRSVIHALEAARDIVYLNATANRFFSYLPLSHAAERGLVEFGAIYSGGSISFVQSLDTFSNNIRGTLPTHFFGVPRIWEKFQGRIQKVIPEKRLTMLLRIPGIAYLIKLKIKKSLGLQRARILLTGAAPISADLLKWFQRIGMNIQEAYGMSENFNVCSINPKGQIRIGSVGKLFDGQEIVIDPETREIIQRCAWQMKEYFKDPQQTSITLQNGFLHTGDMGELSEDGYLTLTGRVKDCFKTTKGEYIVPGEIEKAFLALPFVDQACVLGTLYPQPYVIVVLTEAGRKMNQQHVTDLLKRTLQHYTSVCMDYQKLKKVIIVKEEWTNENGLLTPTFKMKRNALSTKYEEALATAYWKEESISWE